MEKKNVLSFLFSKSTEPFKRKLGWNHPWMAIYKIYIFG
jgi:hypothetical protein